MIDSNQNNVPLRKWAFPIQNILSIVLAIPATFLFVIMGTFASDSGPNPITAVLMLLVFAYPIFVLVCVTLSQVKRSRLWANTGLILILPPVVPVLMFLFG